MINEYQLFHIHTHTHTVRVHISCSEVLNSFCLLFNVICLVAVYDSFKEYTTVEMLEGDNKYDAGQYGLQVSVTFRL